MPPLLPHRYPPYHCFLDTPSLEIFRAGSDIWRSSDEVSNCRSGGPLCKYIVTCQLLLKRTNSTNGAARSLNFSPSHRWGQLTERGSSHLAQETFDPHSKKTRVATRPSVYAFPPAKTVYFFPFIPEQVVNLRRHVARALSGCPGRESGFL